MTGPGHGRIRAFATEGNSEDASLRAPGRNERRSVGHGSGVEVRRVNGEERNQNQCCRATASPAALAVASSGVGLASDSPTRKQLRKKGSLRYGTRDRRRPRAWMPGVIYCMEAIVTS